MPDDAQCPCTALIECVLAALHRVFHGKPVSKLRAIVGQELVILMGELIFSRCRKSTLLLSVILAKVERLILNTVPTYGLTVRNP